MEKYRIVKEQLDKISSSFCIAKWKQVSVHLESGLTHSCHHPTPHIIPLKELKNNINALHNTQYKKNIRKDMLAGKVIDECEYCNRTERNLTNNYSDKVMKCSEAWALPYLDDIINNVEGENICPSYFEVSFSSICNCSCMYCSPTFSSKWSKEIETFGPYPTETAERGFDNTPKPAYLDVDDNPYTKAFWKWWPELYKKLKFFRITGGEPLLHKDTFKILDYMIKYPKPDLHLSINSNFSINSKIFFKFIEKFKQLSEQHKQLNIFTSCEAKGEKAEYIRHGFNYNYWLENCRTYLTEIPTGCITFMCAYNILSISSFTEYLKDILLLKQEFPMRVKIDVPYLTNPVYLQAGIITKDFLKTIEDSVTYLYNNFDTTNWFPLCGTAFWEYEILKVRRIYYSVNDNIKKESYFHLRKNFPIFIDEYDKRHNSNFFKTFPEYKDFYLQCKELI